MSERAEQYGEGAAATQTFGSLTIDQRVLATASRTIAIRNIATVSVGTHVQPRSVVPLIFAVLFAVAGIGALILMAGDFDTAAAKTGAVLIVLALGLAGLYARPQDKTHYLLISTNDGVLSRFTGPRRETLDEARDILTRKINAADETTTCTIDFENGRIEGIHAAEAQSGHQSTAGSRGQAVAANGATSVSTQAANAAHAAATNGANGRADTSDASVTANRTASSQLGNSYQQNGSPHAAGEQYVDFSHFLPAVVEMHRFYARQPNAEHLEQRLHELELLMRAGAQGAHQKTRLRELTGEVSQILQAYPSAVQIFQNIATLTA